MAKEKVEPPPSELGLTEAAAGSSEAKHIWLFYGTPKQLWLGTGVEWKQLLNPSDELMNAVEIAWTSDKLKVYFWWDNNDRINHVAIQNY